VRFGAGTGERYATTASACDLPADIYGGTCGVRGPQAFARKLEPISGGACFGKGAALHDICKPDGKRHISAFLDGYMLDLRLIPTPGRTIKKPGCCRTSLLASAWLVTTRSTARPRKLVSQCVGARRSKLRSLQRTGLCVMVKPAYQRLCFYRQGARRTPMTHRPAHWRNTMHGTANGFSKLQKSRQTICLLELTPL